MQVIFLKKEYFLLWKNVTQEEPDERDTQGKVWGESVGLPGSNCSTLPNLHVFTNPEAPSLLLTATNRAYILDLHF